MVIYWLFGFFPFNWQAPPTQHFKNGAVRTSGQELRFNSPGIALSIHAPEWLATAIATSSLQVALEVRSAHKEQFGPARIFTLSLDPYLRNLTIAQEGSDLIVRLRNPSTNLNGIPPYVIRDMFNDQHWHRIRLTIARESLYINIDGNNVRTVNLPHDALGKWSPHYRLALGNELTGNRPWLGAIRSAQVTVGNESVDYLSPGALSIPPDFTIPESEFSGPSYNAIPFVRTQTGLHDIQDWALNLVGFVPLGWLIAFLRKPKRSMFVGTVLCATTSFTVELGQVFLPTRIPSVDDLILNTLGGVIGIWLATHRPFQIED